MTLFFLLLTAALFWLLILGFGLTRGIVIPRRKTFGSAVGRGDPTSPPEAGVSGREVDWALSDGAASMGFLIEGRGVEGRGAKGRRIEGQAKQALGVLVVHGFCDSRFGALRWAKPLAPFVSAVAIYDQRGHGDAGGRVFGYGPKEAKDVLAVLDQAKAATGIERWVLLGLSAGAGIAFRAAAEAPEVVGVIAEGCYRHWDTPLPGILRPRRYPVRATILVAGWMLRLLGVDLKTFDRAGWVSKLTVPMLFLHGDHDKLCPIASAQEVAAAAVDGTFIAFPGAGHLDLHDVDPQHYQQALAAYFARLDQSSP